MSAKAVVARLDASPGAIYRSLLHDDLREVSLEIARRRQPDIVAMGSSLTFDFREEFFTRSFACAGGVMDTLADGEYFAAELLKTAQPKILLLILNFWWFTDTGIPGRGQMDPTDEAPRLSASQIRVPYNLLVERKISLPELFGLQPPSEISLAPPQSFGLMALLDGVGRRADGSQLNLLLFDPRAMPFYAPVRDRLKRIDQFILEPGRFGPDKQLDPNRLEALKRMVERFEAAGVHVVLINPPMAPAVVEAMAASGRHRHYFDFGPALNAAGLDCHDYHDPAAAGIRPSEFADTHHAGNVAYMRLLLSISRTHPDSELARSLAMDRLENGVAQYSGAVVAVLEKDRGIHSAETDFLALGVQKPTPKQAH